MTLNNKILVNNNKASRELIIMDDNFAEYSPDVDFDDTLTMYSTMVSPRSNGTMSRADAIRNQLAKSNAELISGYSINNPDKEPSFLFAVLNFRRGNPFRITVYYDIYDFNGFKTKPIFVSDYNIKGYDYLGGSPLEEFQDKILRVVKTINGKLTREILDEASEYDITSTQPDDTAIILGWGQDYLVPLFKSYGYSQIQ